MATTLGGRLSIEQIDKRTKELLDKNQELLDKWKDQQRQIRNELRGKQKPGQGESDRRF